MISPEELRQAMAKFATGVMVIGSLEADGQINGMTTNAFTSVSLEPPTVLVCVAHQNHTYRNVVQHGRFGVSLLNAHQEAVAHYYALEHRYRVGDVGVKWQTKEGGSPGISDSLAFLECRVVAHYDHGDHAIFVAEVEEIATGHGLPLLFYDRRFQPIVGSTGEGAR